MNNVIGGFEELVEKGQSTAGKIQKSTAKSASNFAKTASTQVSSSSNQPTDQGTNEAGGASSQQQMSNDDAQKFLKDLYGVKPNNQNNPPPQQNQQSPKNVKTALGMGVSQGKAPSPSETIKTAMGIPQSPEQKSPPPDQNPVATALGVIQKDPNEGKTPEEIAKIEALRQQLHKDYYESLTRSRKPDEEHVTEKLEREDEEEKMSELEVQKKKPPPLPATVKRGTGETVVGVSG